MSFGNTAPSVGSESVVEAELEHPVIWKSMPIAHYPSLQPFALDGCLLHWDFKRSYSNALIASSASAAVVVPAKAKIALFSEARFPVTNCERTFSGSVLQ